ncbi:MAG: hypothetical protein HRU38_05840 [Saccharospirillaceae bacterium]|nr:hypothetical protein [Pseudomonadales bacterium]NRB78178.1 hypothetical protein [Saccharospirillaceae bacterium]
MIIKLTKSISIFLSTKIIYPLAILSLTSCELILIPQQVVSAFKPYPYRAYNQFDIHIFGSILTNDGGEFYDCRFGERRDNHSIRNIKSTRTIDDIYNIEFLGEKGTSKELVIFCDEFEVYREWIEIKDQTVINIGDIRVALSTITINVKGEVTSDDLKHEAHNFCIFSANFTELPFHLIYRRIEVKNDLILEYSFDLNYPSEYINKKIEVEFDCNFFSNEKNFINIFPTKRIIDINVGIIQQQHPTEKHKN